jgi:hypothetical protein
VNCKACIGPEPNQCADRQYQYQQLLGLNQHSFGGGYLSNPFDESQVFLLGFEGNFLAIWRANDIEENEIKYESFQDLRYTIRRSQHTWSAATNVAVVVGQYSLSLVFYDITDPEATRNDEYIVNRNTGFYDILVPIAKDWVVLAA